MNLKSANLQLFSSKDLNGPDDVQEYKLGTRIIVYQDIEESKYNQEWIYCKASTDIGDQNITDDGKGKPHMIGGKFETVDWSVGYNPDMAQVIMSAWNIKAGQYSFFMYKGEYELRMEGNVYQPEGQYLKAEGDLTVFGRTTLRTAYTVGFTTQSREVDQVFVKGCLFGIQTAVSTAGEETDPV